MARKNCSQNKSPSCKFAKTCWDGKVYLALGVVASAYIPKLLPHIGSGGLSALHWAIYQSARVLRAKNIEPIGEFKLKSLNNASFSHLANTK
ncbi:hypothetical protein TYRP_001274 [Tyrophagus putrescentiae]|nr:hypothetical protein TYRP_001274 [Tyrophagus putrescentiae]